MRTLVIIHQQDAGPGIFAEPLRDRGHVDKWCPAENPAPDPLDYDALLVCGGAMHPNQDDLHPWLEAERDLLASALVGKVPVLGICLGAELLVQAAGGAVHRAAEPEIGWYETALTDAGRDDPVLGGLPPRFTAFQWHSYTLRAPPGSTALAEGGGLIQAIAVGRSAYAIQFHAEVTREIVQTWIDDYAADPDAVKMGLDPLTLGQETDGRIAEWNELGRRLAERFAVLAATAAAT